MIKTLMVLRISLHIGKTSDKQSNDDNILPHNYDSSNYKALKLTPQSLCSSLIKNMQLLINYNSLITIHRHENTKEKSSTNMIRHLKVSPID